MCWSLEMEGLEKGGATVKTQGPPRTLRHHLASSFLSLFIPAPSACSPKHQLCHSDRLQQTCCQGLPLWRWII